MQSKQRISFYKDFDMRLEGQGATMTLAEACSSLKDCAMRCNITGNFIGCYPNTKGSPALTHGWDRLVKGSNHTLAGCRMVISALNNDHAVSAERWHQINVDLIEIVWRVHSGLPLPLNEAWRRKCQENRAGIVSFFARALKSHAGQDLKRSTNRELKSRETGVPTAEEIADMFIDQPRDGSTGVLWSEISDIDRKGNLIFVSPALTATLQRIENDFDLERGNFFIGLIFAQSGSQEFAPTYSGNKCFSDLNLSSTLLIDLMLMSIDQQPGVRQSLEDRNVDPGAAAIACFQLKQRLAAKPIHERFDLFDERSEFYGSINHNNSVPVRPVPNIDDIQRKVDFGVVNSAPSKTLDSFGDNWAFTSFYRTIAPQVQACNHIPPSFNILFVVDSCRIQRSLIPTRPKTLQGRFWDH